MQRYFLHITNGASRLDDPEGAEFGDIAEAKAEAIQSARELISQCVLTGLPIGLHRLFEIADAEGRTAGPNRRREGEEVLQLGTL